MAREYAMITLPALWGEALLNDDASGLTMAEANECKAIVDRLARDGWKVVDVISARPDGLADYTMSRLSS
jgi:hypothetical protein